MSTPDRMRERRRYHTTALIERKERLAIERANELSYYAWHKVLVKMQEMGPDMGGPVSSWIELPNPPKRHDVEVRVCGATDPSYEAVTLTSISFRCQRCCYVTSNGAHISWFRWEPLNPELIVRTELVE